MDGSRAYRNSHSHDMDRMDGISICDNAQGYQRRIYDAFGTH